MAVTAGSKRLYSSTPKPEVRPIWRVSLLLSRRKLTLSAMTVKSVPPEGGRCVAGDGQDHGGLEAIGGLVDFAAVDLDGLILLVGLGDAGEVALRALDGKDVCVDLGALTTLTGGAAAGDKHADGVVAVVRDVDGPGDGSGVVGGEVGVGVGECEHRLCGAGEGGDGASVPAALVGGGGVCAVDAALVGVARATIERVVGVGPAALGEEFEDVKTGASAVVFGGGELDTGQLLDAAGSIVGGRVCNEEVLVGDGGVVGEGAVGGAGDVLVGGRVEVDELEFGVVGDGDDPEGAGAAAVDKGVAEANGAHVERTEGTGCETTVYAVLEEVRITAAVGTLRTEDLGRVVEAGVVGAGAADELDLAEGDGCEGGGEGRGGGVGARGGGCVWAQGSEAGVEAAAESDERVVAAWSDGVDGAVETAKVDGIPSGRGDIPLGEVAEVSISLACDRTREGATCDELLVVVVAKDGVDGAVEAACHVCESFGGRVVGGDVADGDAAYGEEVASDKDGVG
ncbi:hypothetical protein L1887_54955 [Cichorium endivia]|nr:hypothetical protein L1887_54955 [Cichorium endivia]